MRDADRHVSHLSMVWVQVSVYAMRCDLLLNLLAQLSQGSRQLVVLDVVTFLSCVASRAWKSSTHHKTQA